MTDLKTKSAKDATVLIYDAGLFTHLAEALVGQFKRVLYFNPSWKQAFPSSNQVYIGDGIPGVERVEQFWDIVDEVDLFVFPDIHNGDLQEQLKRMGKLVFGSGYSEEIEIERWAFKNEVLKDLGMPVQPVKRILGTKDLRKWLDDPKNVPSYVKVSLTRKDMESRKVFSRIAAELWICELEYKHGPIAREMEFIWEAPIPTTLELGYDGIVVVNQYADPACHGCEIKDAGYFMAVQPYATLPEPIKYVNEKMRKVWASYGLKGKISTEIRIGKDGKFYFIDPCQRFGSPPSQIECSLITNLGEVMYMAAQGVLIKPVYAAKYAVQVFMYSEKVDKEWVNYKIEPGYEKHFKFSFKYMDDKEIYTIPQNVGMAASGSVVALADDPMTAIKRIVEYSGKIEAECLDIRLDSLPKAVKQIHEATKKGYRFGTALIPSVSAVAEAVI